MTTDRPTLRRPSRWLLAGAALAGALTAGPTAAWATHQFSDVPDDHAFAEEIQWLVANGITEGYDDGTFKPRAPVSRQSMAALLSRMWEHRTTRRSESLSAARTYTSSTWTTIPELTSQVVVPDGMVAQVVATFTAESACYGATGWCSVRIMAGGQQMAPAVGYDFAFDSSNAGEENSNSWEGHGMQRTLTLPAGSHTISVQAAIGNGTPTFRLDDMVLTLDVTLEGAS